MKKEVQGRKVTRWEKFLSATIVVLVVGMILQNYNARESVKLVEKLEKQVKTLKIKCLEVQQQQVLIIPK